MSGSWSEVGKIEHRAIVGSGVSRVRILTVAVILVAWLPSVGGATGFGVNAHIPSNQVADRIQYAGIEWVRIDVLWSFIEPERDVYDWDLYDRLVDRLEARGLRIYAGLGATPDWATSGSPFNGVPDDPNEWREFCYLVADRYAGRVHAWGPWNEPNLDRFWEGSRGQFIDEILFPAAEAIRMADPSAIIGGPDLAHLKSADWDDWLYAIITAASDVLDVVTHHVYPSNGDADTVTQDLQYGDLYPWGDPAVRDILQDTGWWRRPFWLTETGVQSAQEGEGRQARFVRELLDQWYETDRRSRNWVDRFFFYEMVDAPSPSDYTFGLLHGSPDFVEKPAYAAYIESINELRVFDAEVVSHSLPAFVLPGEEFKAQVAFRNTGNADWADHLFTSVSVEVDAGGWTVISEEMRPDELVSPGEVRAFTLAFTAPTSVSIPPEPAEIRVRMDFELDEVFGELLRHRITVTEIDPPQVVGQPASDELAPGQWTTLRVDTTGYEPFTYRWFRNGVPIEDSALYAGGTEAELTITALDPEVAAFYLCEISNEAGTVRSDKAEIIISNAPRDSGGRVTPDPRPVRGGPNGKARRITGPPERH